MTDGNRAHSAAAEKAVILYERLLKRLGMPDWGRPLPALDELVSTILSQNTNDRNRDAAFHNLRKTFPTWEEVRDAPPEKVIEAIRTAGLANQKGPRIQAVLRQISQQHGTLDLGFLKEWEPVEVHAWLSGFKGVGPKTAAIVMLFSLGMPAFPVDTHIYRVSGRLGLRPLKMSVEDAHPHLAALFPPETYGPAHMNLIRLGRLLCHPRNPDCADCPLSDLCDDYSRRKAASE